MSSSMSLHTRPCDLLVTDDSHMSDVVSSRALSTSRHFWPCTQMELRSSVRARFDTVSSTEHRSPNAGRVGTCFSMAADRLTLTNGVAGF